jgi:polyhydroxyalkanoate synthesis regulator phasin
VTVGTPQQAAEDIIEQVDDLVAAGSLNRGQGNALIARLEAAIASMDRGNTQAAIRQMEAFIRQVEAFVASGVLTPEEAQPLLDAAHALMARLEG